MARLLFWLILIPLAAAAVTFAVINRQPVSVDLWPSPFVLSVPAWLLGLAGAALGFVIGGVASWRAGSSARSSARAAKRRVDALERELALEREKTARLEKAAQGTVKGTAQASALPGAAANGPALPPAAAGRS